MALLYLLQEFCALHDITLRAVTVDHGLREAGAHEAEMVSQHCARLGVPHDTVLWENWDGKGNLQKSAREARYEKMTEWAAQYDISTIAVGHTADDQAETVLMRLSRSAGVDGLSGIPYRTLRNGITWVRPLLKTQRAVLRAYLQDHDIHWADDPSNHDERFDRVKARKALKLLSELGITQDVLAEVADHLTEARKALDWQTFLAAKEIVRIEANAVMIDDMGLRLQPDEIQRRVLLNAIKWINGSPYSPRRGAVAHVMAALANGKAGTLDGVHLRRIGTKLWVFREHRVVSAVRSPTHSIWDGQWRLLPFPPASHGDDLHVTALGAQGLEHCPDWRATGRPQEVLKSTPAIWRGQTLVAAPFAGFEENWHVEHVRGKDAFFATLLSH